MHYRRVVKQQQFLDVQFDLKELYQMHQHISLIHKHFLLDHAEKMNIEAAVIAKQLKSVDFQITVMKSTKADMMQLLLQIHIEVMHQIIKKLTSSPGFKLDESGKTIEQCIAKSTLVLKLSDLKWMTQQVQRCYLLVQSQHDESFQALEHKCEVNEMVFELDEDWDLLHANIVDLRSHQIKLVPAQVARNKRLATTIQNIIKGMFEKNAPGDYLELKSEHNRVCQISMELIDDDLSYVDPNWKTQLNMKIDQDKMCRNLLQYLFFSWSLAKSMLQKEEQSEIIEAAQEIIDKGVKIGRLMMLQVTSGPYQEQIKVLNALLMQISKKK